MDLNEKCLMCAKFSGFKKIEVSPNSRGIIYSILAKLGVAKSKTPPFFNDSVKLFKKV